MSAIKTYLMDQELADLARCDKSNIKTPFGKFHISKQLVKTPFGYVAKCGFEEVFQKIIPTKRGKAYDVNFLNKNNPNKTDDYYNISQYMIDKLKNKLGLKPVKIREHKVEL